jgi:hypothetical protein
VVPVVDLELEETADLRVNPGVSPRAVHLREERLRATEVADHHRVTVVVEELVDHHRVTVEVEELADHHRATVAVEELADHHRVTVEVAPLAGHHRVTVEVAPLAVAWVLAVA